jgi:hypothetical protein
MADLILGPELDKYQAQPSRNPLKLDPMAMNSYRPTRQESYDEWKRNKDKGWVEKTSDFITGISRTPEYFIDTWLPAFQEDESITKGILSGDPDAYTAVLGMADIGTRDMLKMGKMAMENIIEPDKLSDEEKFERHYQRQQEFYDYMLEEREQLAKEYANGKYQYDIKAGADFLDATQLIPSLGVYSKASAGTMRKALKTGAKGVEYSARVAEKASSAINTVARFPRKVTGSTPWNIVQTVGGSAWLTGQAGALASVPAVFGLTELLSKFSQKVNKNVADVAKVFAKPSSHERFLFRLAKDPGVSEKIRKLATRAYKLQGTKMYDIAFDALVSGASAGVLQSALQYSAGFGDEQAGMAFGTGFALGAPVGGLVGPRGSGKDTAVGDAQNRPTARTNQGIKEYLDRKNDNLNKTAIEQLAKKSPKSVALLTTLDSLAPIEGLKISILDLQSFTDHLNTRFGQQMKADDAPSAHYDRDQGHIILNESQLDLGVEEASHIFAHELGHHFIKQKLGEDVVAKRLMLEPFMDDNGQEFYFLDAKGQKIPGMLPIRIGEEGVKFAKNYADRIRPSDPQQAKLIEQDASLLAEEIGADTFAMYFNDKPNAFDVYQPKLRNHLNSMFVGGMRRALSRFGLVNEKTGESIAISPDMKIPKDIKKLYENYIKESQEIQLERANAVDTGRKIFPKGGQTTNARFKEMFGGMGWSVQAGEAFRVRDQQGFDQLKSIIDNDTKDMNQKNVGLGRDNANQNLSAGTIDWLKKNSLNPDQTESIINWFQQAIDNRMRVIFPYRGASKKKYSNYNPFYQRNVTLFGWTWGRKAPGQVKDKQTGKKIDVFPNLQVRGYDYDVVVSNITAMAQAGLLDKKYNGNVQKFADDLMQHSKKSFSKLGPEDPINPQGLGENELFAMAFGIDQLTVESLKDPINKQFWSTRKDKGIGVAIKQYDVASLAGVASTGKDGFALDYYNVRDNFMPSASMGFNKTNKDNLSVMYIKGEKFTGTQKANPFEQKFIDGRPVYYGGRFFDLKSERDVTNKTFTGMQIGSVKTVNPQGSFHRPFFDISNIETQLPTAHSSKVGPTVKMNLIDGRNVSTGNKFKWIEKFKNIDNEWLVSFESSQIPDLHPEGYKKVKHAFALGGESQVPVKLNTVSNENAFYGPNTKKAGQLVSNPRGRPIMKGEVELGPVVGIIEFRKGEPRPVYENVKIKPVEGNEKYYMPKSKDHGVVGNIQDGEILYSKPGELWMLDHTEPFNKPRGHPWRYRQENNTVYWWEKKPSEVDREQVLSHLERKGYKVKRNKVLEGSNPDFAKDYEDAHAFPLMDPPKEQGNYMPYVGTPVTIRPEPEKGLPFGRMSTKFIGSGEGKSRGTEEAQGFGWGLYFAEDKDVAEWYRQTYSRAYYDGKGYNKNDPRHEASKWLAEYTADGSRDRSSAMSTLDITGKNPNSKEGRIRRVLQEGNEAKVTYSGNLYEVKLAPTVAELLVWDKKFSLQHPSVQEKILQLPETEFLKPWLEQDSTGGQLYIELSKRNGYKDYQQASKELASVGIRGNKYKDGPSRMDPAGQKQNYNYVIFDDKDVEIVRRQYMPKAKKAGKKPRKIEGLSRSEVQKYSALQKDNSAVNVGVASLRNQVLPNIPYAQKMAKQQYHTSFMNQNRKIADAIGATVVDHNPVIGGWKDTENYVLNRENSHRLSVKFAYPHQAELYTALIGSLAPEVQNSVLMTEPKQNGNDHSFTIDLAPGRGDDITQLEFLDQYGLAEGFTYDADNNKLTFDIKTSWQAGGYASVQKLYQDLTARGDATAITGFRASVGFPEVSDYKKALSPARLRRYYKGASWDKLHDLASQARDRLKYNPRKASREHIKKASAPEEIILKGEKDGREIEHPALSINVEKPVFLDKNFIGRDMGKMQARGWNQFIEINAEADNIQLDMADAGLGPETWPKILGLRSNFNGSTDIPANPATLHRWVTNPDEFQAFWTSKVEEDPAYIDSAMQGLKSLEPNYRFAKEGKLPDMMVALNTIWGVFSIATDPTSQESGWGAFTNDPVAMESVWDSINGKFKMSKDQWKGIINNFLKSSEKGGEKADVFELAPSGHGAYGQMPKLAYRETKPFAGNSVTMNANSTWNTLTRLNGRWSEFTGMLNDSSMTGSQIRDEFFKAGFAGASIGPKILSFVISTLGRNDLAIIDRWQLINFWSDFLQAQQPDGSDIFTYQKDGTPVEKTNFYDNYAQMIAGNRTMGQIVHKSLEAGMQRILSDNETFLRPFYEKHGIEPSVFGLHWPLWNFKKKEAVGHSSLDVTQKFLLNDQYPTTDGQFPVFQQQFASEPKYTDEVKRLPQSDPTAPAKRIRRRHIIDKAGAKPRVIEGAYFGS